MTGDSLEPADEVLEGRIVDGPGKVPLFRAQGAADHWPAFRKVFLDEPGAGSRLADRPGCQCADCLADKYSGEDFY